MAAAAAAVTVAAAVVAAAAAGRVRSALVAAVTAVHSGFRF